MLQNFVAGTQIMMYDGKNHESIAIWLTCLAGQYYERLKDYGNVFVYPEKDYLVVRNSKWGKEVKVGEYIIWDGESLYTSIKNGENKAKAYFNYTLNVTCPHCGEEQDLVLSDNDSDSCISYPLLNNKWEMLKNMTVLCESCMKEFDIEEVIY